MMQVHFRASISPHWLHVPGSRRCFRSSVEYIRLRLILCLETEVEIASVAESRSQHAARQHAPPGSAVNIE